MSVRLGLVPDPHVDGDHLEELPGGEAVRCYQGGQGLRQQAHPAQALAQVAGVMKQTLQYTTCTWIGQVDDSGTLGNTNLH